MTTAISVENLGKRYRIGHEVKRATTKREALTNAVQAPFRYLKYRLSEATDEDTLWALKDVSFEVKQGEVLGISRLRKAYGGPSRPQRLRQNHALTHPRWYNIEY